MVVSRVRPVLGSVGRGLRDMDALSRALRLTLLGLLLLPIGGPVLKLPITALCGAGLLVPGLIRRSGFWWLLAALTGWRVTMDWPLADNHAYLLVYWCLAAALSTRR